MIQSTIRRLFRRWWWAVVISFALLALRLGFQGFRELFQARGQSLSDSEALYRALQLFTLESGSVDGPINLNLQIARFLAPAVAAYAAGLALFSIFYDQYRMLRLRFFRGHVIVCGLGRKGRQLVEELWNRGDQVVVIESNDENADLDRCRELGATVLVQSANDRWTLETARVHRAKMLISVTGNDGANVETAVLAHKLNVGRTGAPLRCVIHVGDRGLQSALKQQALFANHDEKIDLDLFNAYETGARVMLRGIPAVQIFAGNPSGPPHLLVVGLGHLGEALLVRAVRNWSIDPADAAVKLRCTVIESDAAAREHWFRLRYPELDDAADLHFLSLDVHSHAFASGEFLDSGSVPDVSAAYVCLDDDSLAMYVVLRLRKILDRSKVPIVVRMSEDAGLATLLGAGRHGAAVFDGIQPVGVNELTCTLELVEGGAREMLARAIHQEYIARQLAEGGTPETNPSLIPWEKLREDLKNSNRRQAEQMTARLALVACELVPAVDGKVALMQFTPDEIERMAQREHQDWVEERFAANWKYGERKDVELRISPYLVPWERLPEHVKDYDRHAVSLIPKLLAKADYAVRRTPAADRRVVAN